MKEFVTKVAQIQATLKAPKGQMNKFGNYRYRSCEDILEALKPLLTNTGIALTINDELVTAGNRFYIKATATLTDGVNSISNSALARESEEKKGMDTAQVTGACSSYARKYALNGLLLIDDTKDADATETHGKEEKKVENKSTNLPKEVITSSSPTISGGSSVATNQATEAKKGGWSSRAKKTTETTSKGDLY